MLVVRRHGGPDAGAPPPSLQSVEIPAAGALGGGGEGNGLESGQVPEGAGIWAVFHGDT